MMGKILAASGLITGAGVYLAQQMQPSIPTSVLIVFASITLGSNMALGIYAKYREARSKADAHDIRREMDGCKAEIQSITADRDRWKDLYQALAGGPSPRSTRPRHEPR